MYTRWKLYRSITLTGRTIFKKTSDILPILDINKQLTKLIIYRSFDGLSTYKSQVCLLNDSIRKRILDYISIFIPIRNETEKQMY